MEAIRGFRGETQGGLLPPDKAPPMPAARLPQYRWPSERHLTPERCACGARLLVSDVPTADHPLTDVTCYLCSRVACELIADAAPRRLTPDEFKALPTQQGQRSNKPKPEPQPPKKRGPQPTYENVAVRQRAYRLRVAAGVVVRQRWAKDHDACSACGTTEHPHNAHGRCMRCRDRSQEPYRAARRGER